MHYIYIARCSDNSLYTGYTTNVIERIAKHNMGKGAKYTRVRLPITLVYTESFETKSEAMQREYTVKQLTRKKKLELIATTTIINK